MEEKAKLQALKNLTETEKRILSYIAQNKTSREIAKALFVSVRTVQNHRYNIARKLGLKGANKLLEFAIEQRVALADLYESDKELSPPAAAQHSGSRSGWIYPLALLLVLIIIVGGFFLLESSDSPAADPLRIAVMPLRMIGPDSSNAYLADGFTEELITQISRNPDLRVIARSSVMRYKNKPSNISEIVERLGVGSILEGSLQKEGDLLRINLQLVDASSRANLWSQTFDRRLSDILSVQREIAWQVAMALDVKLFLEGLEGAGTVDRVNEETQTAYLKGRYFLSRNTAAGFEQAGLFFKQALAIDSTFARAWAGLAEMYAWQSNFGFMAPDEAYPQSRRAAQKALKYNPALAEAHNSMAAIALLYDWDFERAEVAFQKALALNPSLAAAHRLYALLHITRGHTEKAVQHTERALKLDPLSLLSNSFHGRALYFARRYGDAVSQYKNTLQLDAGYWLVHAYLGEAYLEKGAQDSALAALEQAVKLAPQNYSALGRLGYGYARSGRTEEARQIVKTLKEQSHKGEPFSFQLVLIYAALGETEQAFVWMQKAFEERHDFMLDLQSDPKLDPLRDDPRYKDFLLKMGLFQPS